MSPPDLAMPVLGASYSTSMRVFSSAAIVALGVYAVRWWPVIAAGGWTSPATLVFIGAFLGMAGSWFIMLRSVTVIDEQGIRQTGLMEKKMARGEVRTARVARWGATRLIIRGERGPFSVFFGGTDELRAAFRRIASARV